MMGRGHLGLVVAVMASGCLRTWLLLQFCWGMMHTQGGCHILGEKEGFIVNNS